MVTRTIDFSEGEFYHIYNRGTEKRNVFVDDSDRDRFVKLLFIANGTNPFILREFPIGLPYVKFERGETITSIGAYCLMPNHFHLLLKETSECGISRFMGKLLTSYSSYFNKKYKRTGRLFEGTYKATHVNNDEYLKYLFSYIHLNPIKIIDPNWKENGVTDYNHTKRHLEQHKYSSYLDYIGRNRVENKIISKEDFPEYFSNFNEFGQFVNEWLSFDKTT